nr:hypothetical protein [uncultured Oribacterium sp.]
MLFFRKLFRNKKNKGSLNSLEDALTYYKDLRYTGCKEVVFSIHFVAERMLRIMFIIHRKIEIDSDELEICHNDRVEYEKMLGILASYRGPVTEVSLLDLIIMLFLPSINDIAQIDLQYEDLIFSILDTDGHLTIDEIRNFEEKLLEILRDRDNHETIDYNYFNRYQEREIDRKFNIPFEELLGRELVYVSHQHNLLNNFRREYEVLRIIDKKKPILFYEINKKLTDVEERKKKLYALCVGCIYIGFLMTNDYLNHSLLSPTSYWRISTSELLSRINRVSEEQGYINFTDSINKIARAGADFFYKKKNESYAETLILEMLAFGTGLYFSDKKIKFNETVDNKKSEANSSTNNKNKFDIIKNVFMEYWSKSLKLIFEDGLKEKKFDIELTEANIILVELISVMYTVISFSLKDTAILGSVKRMIVDCGTAGLNQVKNIFRKYDESYSLCMEDLLDLRVEQYKPIILGKVIPIGFCRFQDYDTSDNQKRIATAFEDFSIYEIEAETFADLDNLRILYDLDIFRVMKYNSIFNSVEEIFYSFYTEVDKII